MGPHSARLARRTMIIVYDLSLEIAKQTKEASRLAGLVKP